MKVDVLLNELKTITMKHKGRFVEFWGETANPESRTSY